MSPVNTGFDSVLFVNVAVLSSNTTVPVAFGKVIVLSAVGSTTVKVVSLPSAVEPSNVKVPLVPRVILLLNVASPTSEASKVRALSCVPPSFILIAKSISDI